MSEEKYIDTYLTDEQLALFGIKSSPETEQYIQVKDVRYTLDEFNRIGDYLLGRNLTDDQQIVLEWLKEEKEERCSFESAIYWYFEDDVEHDIISDRLTQREFLQVLAAFAEWGKEEVAK